MKKVALFVDWDNLRSSIVKIQKEKDFRDFDFNNPSNLSLLFRSFIKDDEEIYRIFFYTSLPVTIEHIHSRLSTKNQKKFNKFLEKNDYQKRIDMINEFINNIVCEEYIALRTGKLQVRGLKSTGFPDLVQKQVDMLIGLDISHISYLKLADKVIVLSKDTDMTPALKVARTNGMEAIIAVLEEDSKLSSHLVKHSDNIRKISLIKISKQIKKSR